MQNKKAANNELRIIIRQLYLLEHKTINIKYPLLEVSSKINALANKC